VRPTTRSCQSELEDPVDPVEVDVELEAGLGAAVELSELLDVELEESLDPEAVVEEEAPRLSFL
jgi:hypothetical protein